MSAPGEVDVSQAAGPHARTPAPDPPAPASSPVAAPPAPAWWEDGRLPGRLVAVLGALAQLTVVVIDLALTGRYSLFSELCFVVVCLGIAVAVRPQGAFVVACCPPLYLVATMAVLGSAVPRAVAHAADAPAQAVVTGLARHSLSLAAGFVLCLVVLGLRRQGRAA